MTLREAWRSLSERQADESPIETAARIVTSAPRCLSLPTYFPSLVDIYVLAWLPLLAISAVMVGHGGVIGEVLSALGAFLAALRLIDIFSTQLGILFVDMRRPGHYIRSVQRSIALNLVNIIQVALIFSILGNCLALLQTSPYPFGPSMTRLDYLYESWTVMLTVGSKFSPTTAWAEVLVMLEVGSGLGLIGVMVAVFLNGLHVRVGGRPADTGVILQTVGATSLAPTSPGISGGLPQAGPTIPREGGQTGSP